MRIEADAILFDNDGVLVDSHRLVVESWTSLAAEYDLDIETLLVELVGVRAVDTLARHLPPAKVDAAVARLEDLEVLGAEATPAISGAVSLLDSLEDEAWTIVTSASERLAKARWRGAGIPAPTRPVFADDVRAGKPDPEPYLVGAARLDVDPARCVVFEDSPSGGAAGAAAGATVVAVGDLEWSTVPAARVADLRRVRVTPGTDGGIVVEV